MRKKILDTIQLTEGMTAEVTNGILKLSKGGESVEKKVIYPLEIKDSKITLKHERPTKKQKKLIKTMRAHINNMVGGIENKYVYKLQICAVHFPITVSVKGDEVVVKNFLGEVKERKTNILPGVKVKVEKEFITVESSDKDKAGQTAANIESSTRICNKDRRVFQDGIYIIEKQKGVKK